MSGVTKNDFSGPVTYMVKNNTDKIRIDRTEPKRESYFHADNSWGISTLRGYPCALYSRRYQNKHYNYEYERREQNRYSRIWHLC
jgi:hypothetical protein